MRQPPTSDICVLGQNARGLIEVLRDSVEGVASVGFVAPLKRELAEAFWRDMLHEAPSPSRVILVATTEQGEVASSVQLSLVQKLLVHTKYRNHGLGRRLMDAIEREAHSEESLYWSWIL